MIITLAWQGQQPIAGRRIESAFQCNGLGNILKDSKTVCFGALPPSIGKQSALIRPFGAIHCNSFIYSSVIAANRFTFILGLY